MNSATTIVASDRWLFRLRNAVRQRSVPVSLRGEQWRYVRAFLYRHRGMMAVALALLAVTTAAEVSLPLIAHAWEQVIVRSFEGRLFFAGLPVALGALGLFMLLTAAAIYVEQRLLRSLANAVRIAWLQQTFRRHQVGAGEGMGALVAKFAYYLGLFETGIQQALIGACRWLFLTIGLLVLAVFIDPFLLMLCLLSVPVDFCVMGIAHLVSRRYVSREQTLSSRILRQTVAAVSNHRFLRNLHLETTAITELARLMELDAFFRIRRVMWLRGSNTILFVALTLGAIAWFSFQLTSGFSLLGDTRFTLVYGMVSALLVQKLYLSTRIGLFLYPLHIGAMICLPGVQTEDPTDTSPLRLQTLTLRSRNARLNSADPLRRAFQFSLRAGQTLEISGQPGSGRSTLATIFAGAAPLAVGQQWSIRANDRFIPYAAWQWNADMLYIDPLFSSSVTLLEWFTTTFGRQVQPAGQVEAVLQRLSAWQELQFILQLPRTIGTPFDAAGFSLLQRGLLQLARCAFAPPSLLLIDHVWFDIGDPRFAALLRRVRRECPAMMVVCFTGGGDATLAYDERATI